MQIKEDKWKLLSARTEDTRVDQRKDTIVEFIKWLSYGILQIWGIIESVFLASNRFYIDLEIHNSSSS